MDDLIKAAKLVLDGFDKGVFVRDVSRDGDPGWTIRLLPYIAALGRLRGITSFGSPETQGPSVQHLLREVAKLPSPTTLRSIDRRREYLWCQWCDARWSRQIHKSGSDDHPYNGCLWPRAKSAERETT